MVTNKNQVVWDQVQPLLANGEFDEAREMTGKDESTISKVLNMGLSLQGAVGRREDIEIAMEESMMEIVPRLEKRGTGVEYRDPAGAAWHDHGSYPGLYGGRQREPG